MAKVKGLLFYAFTLLLSVPLFVIMVLLTPASLMFDKHRCNWLSPAAAAAAAAAPAAQ